MLTVKQHFEREVDRLVAEARAIAAKAEADGARGLKDDERAEIEKLIAQTTEYRARIEDMNANQRLLDAIDSVGDKQVGEPTFAPAGSKSIGEAFVKAEAYRGLKARGLKGNWTTGPIETGFRSVGAKLTDAGLSVESITAAGGALPLQPQVEPLLTPIEEALDVANLFGQGTATQNSIVYLEETTTQTLLGQAPYSGQSSAANTTVEGGVKPAVFIDFTKRSTSVEKIAAFLPVAEEMLEDEPQIASYINGRLVVFVRQAEEAYLMNKLLGNASLSVSAGTDVQATPNMFDKIAAGILKVQTVGGLNPDAVLIHPQDFWTMSTSKASTAGTYFSGGPYAPPSANPWGLKVVISREAMNGFPLVGAFREGATLFRKGGLSVEASNSHSDYFRKDLVALRAEERMGLVILRPKAFCKCT
jgi:HK97 family phage major capsid protein